MIRGVAVDDGGFAMAPLVRALSPQAMRDWLDSAAPGDRLVYAEGCEEPRSSPAWAVARHLYEARAVVLVAEPMDGPDVPGRRWRWAMDKRAPAGPDDGLGAVEQAQEVAPLMRLPGDALDLLSWLITHPDSPAVALPPLQALGEAIGLRPSCAKQRARYLLRVLEGTGRIALRADAAAGGARVAELTL